MQVAITLYLLVFLFLSIKCCANKIKPLLARENCTDEANEMGGKLRNQEQKQTLSTFLFQKHHV